VDVFNATLDAWSTLATPASLSGLSAASLPELNLAFFAGGSFQSIHSNAVGIFNAAAGVWSTAALSEPRSYLSSATLPCGLVLFAGGSGDFGTDTSCFNCNPFHW